MPKPEARLWSGEAATQDLADLLATPLGRRVLWRIISGCGVWARSSTVNGLMQWQEGKREVGIALMEEIDAINPNAIPLMMQEQRNANLEDTL